MEYECDFYNNLIIKDICYNTGSLSKILESLIEGGKLSVKVFYTKLVNAKELFTLQLSSKLLKYDESFLNKNYDYHERLVTLSLNSTPVVLAISQTANFNVNFVSLLYESKNNAIGKVLFSSQSLYKRINDMVIDSIFPNQINHMRVFKFFKKYNLLNKKIIVRTSYFTYEEQIMRLIEFILPSLNNFIINI